MTGAMPEAHEIKHGFKLHKLFIAVPLCARVRGVMRERDLLRTHASPRRVPLPARTQDQTTQTTARVYLASTTPSSVVMFQVTRRLLLCSCSKCQKPANQKEETRAAGGQEGSRHAGVNLLFLRSAELKGPSRGEAVLTEHFRIQIVIYAGSEDGYQRECGAMGRSALWLLITACILEMVRPECCASHGMRIVVFVDR